MNPESILSSEETLARIDAMCRRRLSDENDAMECTVFIIDSLRDSNFRRLRAFQGKSAFSTFLYTLIHRLITEFQRKKRGRRRFPKAVTDIGIWAIAVFKLVCDDRFTIDEAYTILKMKNQIQWEFPEYEKQVEPIRNIPCPEVPVTTSLDLQMTNGFRADEPNPLEMLLEKSDHDQRIQAGKIIRSITETFSEQDQALIRMVYGSDMTITSAAKVIGISPDAARKRLKRLMVKYKEQLLAEGIREVSIELD